jgi:hypothetical protein
MFTLARDGDSVEQGAWFAFLARHFPQYERFWQSFVVALTERINDRANISFRPQKELDAAGRPDWHVAVAQLHYTTLLHLVRVHELRRGMLTNRDAFVEAMTRLYAASDTAFELLGRCLNASRSYDAWTESAGKEARGRWKKENDYPLRPVREYRNCLLHGRVRPEWNVEAEVPGGRSRVLYYPRFDRVLEATDWRTVRIEDCAPAGQLVNDGWTEVLSYLRQTWDSRLIPWATEVCGRPPSPSRACVQSFEAIRAASASSSETVIGRDYPQADEYQGGSASWPPRRDEQVWPPDSSRPARPR